MPEDITVVMTQLEEGEHLLESDLQRMVMMNGTDTDPHSHATEDNTVQTDTPLQSGWREVKGESIQCA